MGLITELTVDQANDSVLQLSTSKRKAIFSMAFLLSGMVLAIMWFAVKETFVLMKTYGTWVDHALVNGFYTAALLYTLLALGFMGYERRLTVDADIGIRLVTYFFRVPLWKRFIPQADITDLELKQFRPAKNVAHEHDHLKRFRNQGYWMVNVLTKKKKVRLDRNTERREMVALALYLERYTKMKCANIDDADRVLAKR